MLEEKMVKGIDVKCKNCHKKFWIELKLNFGARKDKNTSKLLDCPLGGIRFYFKCHYCKKDTVVNIEFSSFKPLEITQIVDNPNYIG